jgi:hypothetical protein
MATRNLTDEFAQLRAELHASRDPSEPRSRGGSQHKGLLDDGGSANPLSAARVRGTRKGATHGARALTQAQGYIYIYICI